MARATGVQISGSAVRVLDLEGSGKKFKVRGYAESAVTAADGDDRVASLGKALKEAFKAAKASREHVILGIATVMSGVELWLAAAHQLVGALTVAATAWAAHSDGLAQRLKRAGTQT